jgi:phytanoyl-CoA hydroxylase
VARAGCGAAAALTQAQHESYFESGYLLVERLAPPDTGARLHAVTAEFIERSRRETCETFDLAPNHSAARPMVRRLKRPDEQHPL